MGPKAPSSRSERAARRAEKMRARSARFFSYLKLEVDVSIYVSICVQQILNKIRLDQLCWIGERIVGGCQGRVRGPWGVVRGG